MIIRELAFPSWSKPLRPESILVLQQIYSYICEIPIFFATENSLRGITDDEEKQNLTPLQESLEDSLKSKDEKNERMKWKHKLDQL